MSTVQLGIKENWVNFTLLVVINFFVGSMGGLERTILPIIGEDVFGLTSMSAALSFIVSFGFSKAIINYFAGAIADRFGRRKVLLLGWGLGTLVPLFVIFASGRWMSYYRYMEPLLGNRYYSPHTFCSRYTLCISIRRNVHCAVMSNH